MKIGGMEKKRSILLVDDLPDVLQAQSHLLRYAFPDWDIGLADSGEAALRMMAERPYDVVVSDMRMPGMNGAELLNEVMRLYPRTVRLILSAFADQEQVLRSVGSTHQYLTKPCDLRSLKTAILRATSLEDGLNNQTLVDITSRMDRVPSLPSLYRALIEKLQDPEVPMSEIAEVIARDIGMTAKILKLVNSAFFGRSREISSALEAVNRLGLETVKSLVLGIHAFSEMDVSKVQGLSLGTVWDHSMRTATLARIIASHEAIRQKFLDETFGAGVLHDTGKLVLACNYPAEYGEAIRLSRGKRVPLVTAEQEVFGASHASVGAHLLGLWGLPVPIVEAIAFHHSPRSAIDRSFTPLTVVHVANVLANELAPAADDTVPERVDRGYLEDLSLGHRWDTWRGLAVEAMGDLAGV